VYDLAVSKKPLDETVLDTGPNTIVGGDGPPTAATLIVDSGPNKGTQLFRPSTPGMESPERRPPGPSKTGTAPGSVLDGRYRLDGIVGAGAMGEVWKAHHLGLDIPVAVKVIANEVEANQAALDRFYREARTMARLSHPNIVRVLDVSLPDSKLPYIAMELLEGETLRQRMKRETDFHLDLARELLGEILGGLGVAHRNGIVHRDLKPANIFLVKDEGAPLGFRLKVLDFGTAILLETGQERLTQEGIIIGTPYYMAPEQAMGKTPSPACDLYAAAVIFYELLSGHVPHEVDDFRALLTRRSTQEADPIRTLVPKLPGPYDPFFSKALALDPKDRFKDALEMRLALANLPRSDGKIASFDDAAFSAALDGAMVTADTRTGAHPARPEPEPSPEASQHNLDEAVGVGPHLYAGEIDDPELQDAPSAPIVPVPESLSLDLDNLEDGDLKRELVARQQAEAGEADADADASDGGSFSRHLLSLVAGVGGAVAVWFLSGGDPKFETIETTPALLAALAAVAGFVGVSVAMTPVEKAEEPAEN
jgi:serine/threonine protein kinase